MKTKKTLLTTFSIVLMIGMYTLQLNAQNVHKFSIESFTQAVKESNIQLKIAEKEKDIVKEGEHEARAAYLPQVNFQSTYQRNFNDQDMYMEFYDFNQMNQETGEIPITLQKFDVGFKNDFQANLLLEQNIFNLKSICELKSARIYSEIGELEYINKTKDIVNNAQKMFLQAVLMQNVYQLNQTSEQNALDNYNAAKTQFENSLISEMDLLQAKMRWENEIPKTQKAKRNYYILLNNLKVVAGIPASDSIAIAYDWALQQSPQNITSMEQVFENREDYQMLEKNNALQDAIMQKEKSEYLPDLKAQVGYSYLSNSDKMKFDENVNKPFYAGLTLTVPILTGGYRKARLNRAKLQHKISGFEQEDARQNITIEVKNLEMKLHEEAEIIKSAQSTLETAQKGYELAEKNAETGLISQLDLRRYSEDLKKAQLNLYFSIFNYECSQIDYNKAIGR